MNGKVLTCHKCGSEWHLQARCDKQQGSHFGYVNAGSTPAITTGIEADGEADVPSPPEPPEEFQQLEWSYSSGTNIAFVRTEPPCTSFCSAYSLNFSYPDEPFPSINEARPLCGCMCRCPHRPGRRITCPGCGHHVCPMNCWRDGPLCHQCMSRPPTPPQPEPEPKHPRVIIEELGSEEEAHDESYVVGIGNDFFLASSMEQPMLLVDTGAGENICGSRFVKEVQKNLPPGQEVTWSPMERPHPVSGVGNDTVYCEWRANIPICLPGGDVTRYSCMYLEDNNTPGLLGTTAMQQAGTIIDLRPGRMHIYSGDTRQVSIDTSRASNYRRYDLVQSKQGHIFLPCSHFKDAVRSNSSASSSS